jgi:hypothetical protein
MRLLKHRAFSPVNEVFVNKNFESQKGLKRVGLNGKKEKGGNGCIGFRVERTKANR